MKLASRGLERQNRIQQSIKILDCLRNLHRQYEQKIHLHNWTIALASSDEEKNKEAYRKVRNILENAFFVTTPPNRRKMGSKSEKLDFFNFFQFLLRGFKQN